MKKILLLLEIYFVFSLYLLLDSVYFYVDLLDLTLFPGVRYNSMASLGHVLNLLFCFMILGPFLHKFLWGWPLRNFGIRKQRYKDSSKYGLMLLSGAIFISSLGFILIPGLSKQIWNAYHLKSWNDMVFFIFFVSVFHAGIMEELKYRVFLQGGLASVLGKGWAILLSALFFAYLHSFQGIVSLLLFHIPTALFLSCVYFKTRNIFILIIVHILVDMLDFFLIGILNLLPGWDFLTYIYLCFAIFGLIYTRRQIIKISKIIILIFKDLKYAILFNVIVSLPSLYVINLFIKGEININIRIRLLITLILFLGMVLFKRITNIHKNTNKLSISNNKSNKS